MNIYVTSPIDFWPGWQLATNAVTDELDEAGLPIDGKISRQEYEKALQTAKDSALDAGWEGDMREGPFVSVLPDPDQNWVTLIIAWKQDNNGTTFIASQVELPYLKAYRV